MIYNELDVASLKKLIRSKFSGGTYVFLLFDYETEFEQELLIE